MKRLPPTTLTLPALALLLAPLLGLPAAAPPPPIDDVHDLVFLHPDRPYRVRLHLRLGGDGFTAGWSRRVADLFRRLDRDGDGRLDAAESGRLPSPRQWAQMLSGAAQIDPDTAPLAVASVGAGGLRLSQVEAVYGASASGPIQIGWYPLVRVGDATGDTLRKSLAPKGETVTRAVLDDAPRRLRRFDRNDDEMLTPQELAGGVAPGRMAFSRLGSGHEAAEYGMRVLSMRPDGDPAVVAKALLVGYPGRDDVRLPAPDLNLRVELDKPDVPVAVVGRPAAGVAYERVGGGGVFRLGGTPVQLLRQGAAAPGATRAAADARTAFDAADLNKDGYLDRGEIHRPPFALVALLRLADADGDGKISCTEYTAFDELRTAAGSRAVFCRVAELGSSLFDVLDTDGDGRLGVREIRDAHARLKPWMPKGTLAADAVPSLHRITLGYGSPVIPDAEALSISRATPPRPLRGPLWFRKMDLNGDGDVSRREWLGTDEQFKAMDADGDGLISAEEARRVDGR